MSDIFSPHHGGVYTPSRKPSWTLPTSTTLNVTALPTLTTLDGKPLSTLITIDGKALNSNNLESMDKPKTNTNIPVLLIGGLIIVLLITKK